MRLIRELQEDVQIIVEASSPGAKPSMFIEGVFLQGGVKNRNGRVYPNGILEQSVQKYINEKISKGRAYGELGHPAGPQINLERVSHLVTSLKADGGGNFIGKAKITEGTPYGAIAKGLIESGAQLGVSSRGLGSLKNRNGIMEVQDDFWLATAGDIVADPSAPDAFVSGIMENVEWICEGGHWREETIREAKQQVNAAIRTRNGDEYEKTAARIFEQFMANITKS